MTVASGLLVGLATIDLIHHVARLPGPDEKVVATRADLAAGGPATGAAVTFAALGGRATLLTALGGGPLAGMAREDLTRHDVSVVDAAPGSPGPAVSATTVVEATGQRSVVSRNAEGVDVDPPEDLDALVSAAGVILVDGHHPRLALAAARTACARGIPVVLDAGSWKPVLTELLPLVTMVVCSATFSIPTPEVSPGGTVAALLGAGPQFVAVTAGPGPVRWWTTTGSGSVAVPRVTVRDTLGAGDVLHGAFAYAVAGGVDEPTALQRAVAVAVLRVGHVGPRSWLSDPHLRALASGTAP